MPESYVLAINPGGGGDHFIIGNAQTGAIIREYKSKPKVPYPASVSDQLPLRQQALSAWLEDAAEILREGTIEIVVSRGPAIRPDVNGRPCDFGIYAINDDVIRAIEQGHLYTVHASQLGPIMAKGFALTHGGIPAIFVDPISGQKLPMMFRFSGMSDIEERQPLGHWLNIHYILQELFGAKWEEKSIIACHFGTGFTIAGFVKGELMNVNNANSGGPFSDTRAGSIGTEQLIEWTASQLAAGKTVLQLKELLQTKGGLAGYLGVRDLEGARELIAANHDLARPVYEAMVCRIGAEIMSRVVEIGSAPDALILTGGMCNDEEFITDVRRQISPWIPVRFHHVQPGSFESKAMVKAGSDVLHHGVQMIRYHR